MINVYFMNVFIVTFCFLSPLLSYDFDKKIAANIYVRLVHSTGCIGHLLPVLYRYPLTIMDPLKITPMPDSVKFIFDRSISYFLWDCIALLIADEEDKGLFILHHLISAFSLSFARYYEYDWYLICMALFLAEITNPITQFSEYLQLIHRENITFEKFYFYSMVLVRGIITPSVACIYTYYIVHFFQYLRNMYLISIFINYSSMNLIMIGSVSWIHKKYLLLYKNNNDKKMS